ncbi:hypothetical protein A5U53_004466, partial [Escherichia coli]|nr:hypothetical protein [Escherichia coli]
FSSDYYLAKNSSLKLIELLIYNYSIKTTSENQNIIASLPWKRCYTTNYDRCFEIAAESSGNKFETIDLEHKTKEYYKRKNLCIHLNGSINNISTETLDDSFKLSDSSYSSPDSFTDSEWFYYFKRDLDRCGAIVFIGYSMYDIEIKKILSTLPQLKEKTFFVTSLNPDIELEFTLEKFGTVLPIGLSGFANRIRDNITSVSEEQEYKLQSLFLHDITNESSSIRDEEVEKMLMYGDLDDHHIDNFILGNTKVPFLVKRSEIDKAVSLIEQSKNVIIYSALGNGKTILLKELRSVLSVGGYDVYTVADIDGDFISDIDYIAQSPMKNIILLDGYEKNLELMEHVGRAAYENVLILATARVADHEYHRDDLERIKFKYSEINIDMLDEVELKDFSKIIDNLGLWGDNAGLSVEQKVRYLANENNSQFSIALLTLLESPQIKNKISDLITGIKKSKSHENTIISICLCQILGIETNRGIISDLAGNDLIYDPDFTNNSAFKAIFNFHGGRIINGSSLFCIHLIKNNFTPTVIIERMLAIASRFNQLNSKDYEQDRIFKAMLRFSFVEQLLPESMKISTLQRYYEKLKIEVPWLNSNPHFWLQYAMCFIAYKNYPKAQQYIDQAYALAEKRAKYHTNNIDTQQAKIYLLSSEKIPDGNIVFSNFEKANNLLSNLDVDIYSLRQFSRYKDFHLSNYNKLSKSNKVKYMEACKQSLNKISEYEGDGGVSQSYVAKVIEILKHITKV